jgi:type II secretory pathway pseudopilin PulG
MNPKHRRHRLILRGFSILELLVAFAIFVTAFLFLLGVFPTSYQALREGRTYLLANAVGQQWMELYMSTPFSALPAPSGSPNPNTILKQVSGSNSMISTYKGSQDVINYTTTVVFTAPSTTFAIFA